MKYKRTILINKKCANPIYFKRFLIIMRINNKKDNLKGKEILEKFKEKYGHAKFKIDGLSDKMKSFILKNIIIKIII